MHALAVSGCGEESSSVPEAGQFPLAPGLEVANSEVRASLVDDSPYLQLVLTSATAKTPRAINRAQVAFLRDQGWKLHQHNDWSTNGRAADRSVWAYIGFAEGDCRGLADSVRTSGMPYICASLG